jgi:hypothetical protein
MRGSVELRKGATVASELVKTYNALLDEGRSPAAATRELARRMRTDSGTVARVLQRARHEQLRGRGERPRQSSQ